jgi:hypothetical protein
LKRNGLQLLKPQKSAKTRKKVSNIFNRTPVFLPKDWLFGPVLSDGMCKCLRACDSFEQRVPEQSKADAAYITAGAS